MRNYKLGLIAALALGSLLACTNISPAQDAQGKKKAFTPQARTERMEKDLNLTADQKTKVQAVFEANAKKYQELREDSSMSREDRRAKMTAIREEENKKLKGILKPDQWEKYQKQMDEMKKKFGEGKGKKKSE